MTEAFSFKSLYSGYSGKTVLSDLSGTIESGRITALIGPNGSGKSTFLRVLGGLNRYSGELRLKGRDVYSMHRKEFGKILGIVSQQINIKSAFYVHEVISFGRLPYHGILSPFSARDHEIIENAADSVGITHLLFRKITELSGGEKQRAVFAMAVAQQADIYLLDEPTSALDPNQAARVFSILRDLSDKGCTIIIAAHDINVSIPFSDSFIALKGGRILSQGASSSIDEGILENLYGTQFERYVSSKGEFAWHPLRK